MADNTMQECLSGVLAYNDTWIVKLTKAVDFALVNIDPLLTSMEQLWLAFVMKEKYNKYWNGEEWTSK